MEAELGVGNNRGFFRGRVVHGTFVYVKGSVDLVVKFVGIEETSES